MRALALTIIEKAAQQAGLPVGRVFTEGLGDNLTLPRPRIEVQYLPETYTRTGRRISADRDTEATPPVQRATRELYVAKLETVANVLAEGDEWLDAFAPVFVAALPRGVNDTRGLWVAVRVQKASFVGHAEKRVGGSAVSVFSKRARLFTIDFTWRVTQEEVAALLTDITITPSVGRG